MKKLKILVIIFALLKCGETSEAEDDKLVFQLDDPIDANEPDDGENDDDIIEMGDMRLTRRQLNALNEEPSKRRHGLMDPVFLWDDAIVPVKIDPGANFSSDFLKTLKSAMKKIMDVSCVKFVWEDEPKSDFIFIIRDQKCASFVGNLRKGEEGQSINIYENCGEGNLIHELLHALGLMHMHTFAERDKFVKIIWDNIQPEQKINFNKFIGQASMFDTDYDFGSIMHYGEHTFAKNESKPTIIPLKKISKSIVVGQREGLSKGDVLRLNRMYSCPEDPALLKESEDTDHSTNSTASLNSDEEQSSDEETGGSNESQNTNETDHTVLQSDDETKDKKKPKEQEVMKIYFFSSRCRNSFSFPQADNVIQIYHTDSGFEVRSGKEKVNPNNQQYADSESSKVIETTTTAPDEDKSQNAKASDDEEEGGKIMGQNVMNHLRYFIRMDKEN